MASLKMIANCNRDGRYEQLIASVRRLACEGIGLAVFDIAERTGDDLPGDGATPFLAFVTDAEAANVQIGVGHDGIEIFFRSRLAAEKITGAHRPFFIQITGDAQFIKPTAAPVQCGS